MRGGEAVKRNAAVKSLTDILMTLALLFLMAIRSGGMLPMSGQGPSCFFCSSCITFSMRTGTIFFRRDLLACMSVQTRFVFLDFNEPVLLFYLDYPAMLGAFIFVTCYVSRHLRRRSA